MAAPAQPDFYTLRKSVPLNGGSLAFKQGRGYYSRGGSPNGGIAHTTYGPNGEIYDQGVNPGRRPPARPAAPVDPLGQTSQAAINAQVAKVAGMYGAPMADSQIQASAQAQLDPIIAAITKQINDRTAASTGAISANSQALAKALGGIDYGAPYTQAKSEQAAVDAALQQSLGGQGGTQLAGDLQSRLAQIGDPSIQAAGDALAQRGGAIAGTEVAHGSSNLGQLIASAAAAKEYGAKMPGIAGLQGAQDIAGVNRQAVSDIGTQTAGILTQLPQVVASLRASNDARRGNRAQAAQQIMETLTGQNITKATAKAGLGVDVAKVQQQGAYDAAKVGEAQTRAQIAQQNANTASYRAQTAAKTAVARAARIANPSLTPGQAATLATKAAKDAEDLYHGVTKPNSKDPKNPTVVSYTQTYQDAIKTLSQRYPSLGKAGVMKLVNAWYKPGQFGRPTAPEKLRPPVKSGGPLGVQGQQPAGR